MTLAFVRGNSPVTGELPTQKASNAENAFILCRHQDKRILKKKFKKCCKLWFWHQQPFYLLYE